MDEEILAELRATNKKLDRVVAILEANMDTPEALKIKYQALQEMFWGEPKNTENG